MLHLANPAKPASHRCAGCDERALSTTRSASSTAFRALSASALRSRTNRSASCLACPCLRETFLCLTHRFLLRLDLGSCFFEGFRGGIRKSSGLTQRLFGSLQDGFRWSRRRGLNVRNQPGERLEPQWTDVVRKASRHRSLRKRRRGRQRFKRRLDATHRFRRGAVTLRAQQSVSQVQQGQIASRLAARAPRTSAFLPVSCAACASEACAPAARSRSNSFRCFQ